MTFGFAARDAAAMAPSADELAPRYERLSGPTLHYSPEVHAASLVLPRWIRDAVEGKKTNE